jgi:hypothetical protein
MVTVLAIQEMMRITAKDFIVRLLSYFSSFSLMFFG